MPIDYGRLISRTWEVFSRNRVLWLLGFIVALTAGGGINSQFNYSSSSNSGTDFQQFADQYSGLLIGLGCLALIAAIVFSFISAAGEAALIATTDHIERTHEQPSFSAAWGLGWPKMVSVWVYNLVYGIIILIILLIFLVPIFLIFGASIAAMVNAGGTGSNSGTTAAGSAFGLICICGCLAFILLIPLVIILGLVREYGLRAVVLENQGPMTALSTGWQLLRANIGASIIASLILLVVGIISGVVVSPFALLLGAPMVAAMGFQNGKFSLPTLLFLGLLLWLVSAAVGAFTKSFQSVLWTLLYRNRRQMPGSELAPVGMMPPGGGSPYGAPSYTPAGAPPPYTPPAGSPPPYNPAGSPPPYMPPASNPPPYTPPAGSPPYSPPPYSPPAGEVPPYTPPAYNPLPSPPPAGAETDRYGTPPPYSPPPYSPPPYTPGETRPMGPPPTMPGGETGPSGSMSDPRARGPEGGNET